MGLSEIANEFDRPKIRIKDLFCLELVLKLGLVINISARRCFRLITDDSKMIMSGKIYFILK